MKIDWQGEGVQEEGIDTVTGRTVVRIDPRYFRPTEVDILLGDSSKAKKALGWKPKVTFDALIDMMIATDMELAKKEKTLLDAGFACSANTHVA